jgi:hypothetical protein
LSQIFHIFRKDVRHHWPEILVSLVVFTAFEVEQPRNWTGQVFDSRFLNTALKALPVLIVLAWAFLIVRLVQGESLVGDRQFWITRPYQWHKLLAAKFLSVLLFIHLPLFLAQLSLLKIAHFPVASSIPGLFYVHLLFLPALLLPSITVGSITSGIGHASLVFLAMFLVLLGLVFLFTAMPDMDFATDATDAIQISILLGGSVAAILIQYIYRRTFLSRMVVGGAILSFVLVIGLAPYETLIRHDFPLATSAHPLPAHFALDRALSFGRAEDEQPNFYGDELELEIPFQITDLLDKTVVQVRGIKLDLDSPNGEHWTSHWHSLYHSISPGRTRDWPAITMKRAVFNRFKDGAVKAHVSLALNVFRLGYPTEVVLTDNHLSLPGGARCRNELSQSWLQCFTALKQPTPLFVVAKLPSEACPVSQQASAEPWAASPAVFADLSNNSTPGFDFTPIEQFSISMARFYAFEDHEIRLPLCPSTPLLVSKPEFLYSVRDEIDLGEITLLNYVPTYPRHIVPPLRRVTPRAPSDKLSWNLPGGFLSEHD